MTCMLNYEVKKSKLLNKKLVMRQIEIMTYSIIIIWHGKSKFQTYSLNHISDKHLSPCPFNLNYDLKS